MSDDLLRAAIAKAKRNEKLTREEQRAIDRAKRDQADRQLREALKSCPKKLYVELSGRQHKVIDEQATRYGLPLLGKSIDLFAAVRALHDLVSRPHSGSTGKRSVNQDPDDDGDWKEECNKERALKLRLERLAICGVLLRRGLVEQVLHQVAALLRQAGERMQQQGHLDAYALLDETLQDAAAQIAELLQSQQPLADEIERMDDD